MRLSFDPHTQKKIIDEWGAHVYVQLINAGCAGKKVIIEPYSSQQNVSKHTQPSQIHIWCSDEDAVFLRDGQIASANNRLYFSSPHTKGRCGCGTSISFTQSKIDLSLTKIHKISNQLSNLPQIQRALQKKNANKDRKKEKKK